MLCFFFLCSLEEEEEAKNYESLMIFCWRNKAAYYILHITFHLTQKKNRKWNPLSWNGKCFSSFLKFSIAKRRGKNAHIKAVSIELKKGLNSKSFFLCVSYRQHLNTHTQTYTHIYVFVTPFFPMISNPLWYFSNPFTNLIEQ